MTGLEAAVKAARERLWALSRGARCAQARAEKTCIQLAELDAVLESSEEEILWAAIVLKSLVTQGPSPDLPWAHLVIHLVAPRCASLERLSFLTCRMGVTRCPLC